MKRGPGKGQTKRTTLLISNLANIRQGLDYFLSFQGENPLAYLAEHEERIVITSMLGETL